jgi:hypothetical protein
MHSTRSHLVTRSLPIALAVVVLCLPPQVDAQRQDVRLLGRVQWIAAQRMMLLPQAGAVPANVDLNQVPLEQYAALAQGNQVAVDGVISNDGRRIIATSVVLFEEARERR